MPTGARSAAPTPTAKPRLSPDRASERPTKGQAAAKPRPAKPPGLGGPPDLDVTPQLTKQGYVFPLFGQASFSSTLGAARANTGWHYKVGGYRLWLRDRQGNQFYYAHLAGYSDLAENGREVRAGQVIGFNGNTGDAQGTPFHVHFEVHPVGLLPFGYDGVVDPYPYLLAWRRLEDVALNAGTGWAPPVEPTATAPLPQRSCCSRRAHQGRGHRS